MEYIKKLGAFSLGPIIGAIIGFVNVPIITHFISPDEYGKSSMFLLAQGLASMVMYLGMDQAFVREFNGYRQAKDRLMAHAIAVPFLISSLIGAVIIVFNQEFSKMLFGNREEFLCVFLLGVLLPFMVIENFGLLSIRMDEKGLLYSFFTIGLKLNNLVFTILFIFLYEHSFRSVIIAIALSEIVNGICLLIYILKKVRLDFNKFDQELVKTMLKFGLPLVPASVLGWGLSSIDRIMLRTMCTYSELGLYTAAFKIVNILGIFQSCFTLFWTPVAYRWYENKVREEKFELAQKIVAFIMTGICLVVLLAKNIFGIILGTDFMAAVPIFPFLLLYPIMYTLSESTCMGITFMRKTKYTIYISTITGVVNLGLNYLLIPQYGGMGAAMATGLSYIVFFWMRTLISRTLWLKFKVGHLCICSIIVVINAAMHTVFNGVLPYCITVVSIIFIVVYYGISLKSHFGDFRALWQKK